MFCHILAGPPWRLELGTCSCSHADVRCCEPACMTYRNPRCRTRTGDNHSAVTLRSFGLLPQWLASFKMSRCLKRLQYHRLAGYMTHRAMRSSHRVGSLFQSLAKLAKTQSRPGPSLIAALGAGTPLGPLAPKTIHLRSVGCDFFHAL